MIFTLEPLAVCWDEMFELAERHWQETEGYRHDQPFSPKFERYKQYEDAGWLFQVIAREAGVMVGYSINYVVPSMHTQQQICVEDTYFLDKPYRKGRNAIRLYQEVEKEARKRGAVEMMMTEKKGNVARLLEHLGFERVATQWSKSLAKPE